MSRKVVVFFNSYDHGSTGGFCKILKEEIRRHEYSTYFISGGNNETNCADFYLRENTTIFDRKLFSFFKKSIFFYKISGYFIFRKVIKFLRAKIDFINDDIIFHFHNLQYCEINPYLFLKFCKKNHIKVLWTLHDCWPFTGGCDYYTFPFCGNRSKKCKQCPKNIRYSNFFYNAKRKNIRSLGNSISFIAPSNWIRNELLEFNKEYTCYLVNNGLNIDGYKKPIMERNGDKPKILSVAFPWSERKGLKFVEELAEKYSSDYEFHVVGLNAEMVKSKNIICYGKLEKEKLFELYCACDVFLNPTLEDNFPTVNIEALLCGLPIVSFDTGGSCEIFDSKTGVKVESKTTSNLEKGLKKILDLKISKSDCYYRGRYFSVERYIKEHLDIYNREME